MSGDGTRAAVASGALAIGLALGIRREIFNEDSFPENCTTVRNTLLSKYYQEYNSIEGRGFYARRAIYHKQT